ncbi:MAG: sialidase family protein, partial [Phycisphaeraceae bacterium]
ALLKATMTQPFDIDLQTVRSGYDGRTCWVDPWLGITPHSQTAVMTLQQLELAGSDVFFGACASWSEDRGATWSEPTAIPAMQRRTEADGLESCVNDVKPHWHEASGTVLGIGVRVYYQPGAGAPAHVRGGRAPETAYTTCDMTTRQWREPRMLQLPASATHPYAVAGSVQRWDEVDGSILLPLSCQRVPENRVRQTFVARCRFDGETLHVDELGNGVGVPEPRGLYEPSLTRVSDRYLLTMRNDETGYVAVSADGLHFDQLQPWRFDDGESLGSYNTQQHWVTHDDRLWLIYTRRGLNNDHVFRHRAPLMIAEVDPRKPAVIRATEQVLVPERGARLGNFGVTHVDDRETWVSVAEWMQPRGCEKHGSDNAVYLARLRWR